MIINRFYYLLFSSVVILGMIILAIFSGLMPNKNGGFPETLALTGHVLMYILPIIVYLVYIIAKEKSWFMFSVPIATNLIWFVSMNLIYNIITKFKHWHELPLDFLRYNGVVTVIFAIIYFIVWKIQVINK